MKTHLGLDPLQFSLMFSLIFLNPRVDFLSFLILMFFSTLRLRKRRENMRENWRGSKSKKGTMVKSEKVDEKANACFLGFFKNPGYEITRPGSQSPTCFFLQ